MNALTGIAASANIAIMGSLLCSVYTTPSPRRNVIITMFLAGGNSVGVIFGGIGSGLVATGWNWRASFVYMAIVFVLVAVVGFFAIPNLPGPYQVQRECPSESSDDEKAGSNTGGMKTPPRKIDWLGLLFGLQGVGCISAALTIAPEDGWGRPWVVVLLIYGAMSLFGFFAWENYTSTPMVPRMVWSNRKMILVGVPTLLLILVPAMCALTPRVGPHVDFLCGHGLLFMPLLGAPFHARRAGSFSSRRRHTFASTSSDWSRSQPHDRLLHAQDRQLRHSGSGRGAPSREQRSSGILEAGQQLLHVRFPVFDSEHSQHGLDFQCRVCKSFILDCHLRVSRY